MTDEADRAVSQVASTGAFSIPADQLSAAALDGLAEAFVLREGTDYGAVEFTHATKVAQVRKQIANGEAMIVFDPETEATTLVTRAEWNRIARAR